MKNYLSVLIVAKPDHLRTRLSELLKTIPNLEIIAKVDDALSALKLIPACFPKLIVLDVNVIHGEPWAVLSYSKAYWPDIKVLVLVDNIQEQQIALTMNADKALLKRFPDAHLFSLIDNLPDL